MRRLSYVLFCLVFAYSSFAQSDNTELNQNGLNMYQIKINNIPSLERAKYMDKLITAMEDVYFCSIDFVEKKGLILTENGFDISAVEEKLISFDYMSAV